MATDDQPPLVLSVSTDLPPEIPGSGFSFAPPTRQVHDTLITADAAVEVALDTGINGQAWEHGSGLTACLAEFTNTLQRTEPVPAWVVWLRGVPIVEFGPHVHPPPIPPQTGIAEWVVDATTGRFLGAADRGEIAGPLAESVIVDMTMRAAADFGVPTPTSIEYVYGTRNALNRHAAGATFEGADGQAASVLVQATGNFTWRHSAPRGHNPLSTGTAITLVIDQHTGIVTDTGISDQPVNLAPLGPTFHPAIPADIPSGNLEAMGPDVMDHSGTRADVDLAAMRGPLRVYDRLTKKIDRYTKQLDRSPNRNRTQTRLREAEQTRQSVVGFIAMGLGTEKAADILGLSKDNVAAARQALNQWALEHSRAEIEEFMSQPETQRRLRRHDTRR